MRDLRWKRFCKVPTFMALLFFLNSSCMEEDPIVLSYVGTWMVVEPVPVTGGVTMIKSIMSLTETSLENVLQKQVVIGQWTDYFMMKGSVSVEGNFLKVAIEEAGTYLFDLETGLPTGVLASYNEGSTEFDSLLVKSGQPETFRSKYSVKGNQMTFQKDTNKDGDFGDEFETTVYTRQEDELISF